MYIMKKILTLGFLFCVFASTAFAIESGEKVRIGVDVDWAWTAMDQVNKQLNKGENVNSLHSGFAGMLNVDIIAAPFLMIGARSGVIVSQPASAKFNYVIYNQTTTIKTSMIPLEAGVSAIFELPTTPLMIKAGVYGGYGFAFASFKNDIDASGQTASFTQPFNGGSFVGELLATVNLKLSSALSLNLNSGYRFAKVSKVEQSEDVAYSGIPGVSIPVGAKGDILKDTDNNDLEVDFSGFNIGMGFSVGF
jgi:hypothetical protein